MEARELKDKASQLFTKGKFAKAAETYEEFCALEKKDHQARLRCGDAWAKAGKKDKAVGAYAMAAEGFAKDGFLPRAIAASKLVLELDPAHKAVQKMLAELYAQKGGGPRPAGAPRGSSASVVAPAPAASAAPKMEISRSVSAPVSSSFTNRKDAIDLDAPVAAKKPSPQRPKAEAPSPMNRADALELPEYEIPMEDTGPSVGGMVAAKGPSPVRRADAIAIELEPQVESMRGQPALTETAIEIEISPGTATTGEVEIAIEGQPLPDANQLPPELQMGTPLVPAAPPAPSVPVFELTVEVAAPAPVTASPAAVEVPLPPASSSNVYDLTETVGAPAPQPVPSAPVYELTDVEAPPPPASPPPLMGEPLLATPAPMAIPLPPAVRPAPVPQPQAIASPAAAPLPPAVGDAASAPPAIKPLPPAVGDAATAPPAIKPLPPSVGDAASAPPVIKPLPPAVGDAASVPPSIKPLAPAEASLPPGLKPKQPEPAAPVASTPSSSRIWIPPSFASAVPRAADAPAAPAGAAATPEPTAPSTDLERSLQTFMQFDPDAPASKAAAQAAPPKSFTELDLDESDSLLHAVDAAARTAAPVAAEAEEEAMEAPEEARLEPGALPKIPLFSDLPEDAFIALFEQCPLQRFDEGQLVFEQGDKADAFYVICGGKVRVFRTDGGERRELATLEEGSFFGEMALLSEAPRSASVEAAAEDTQVLVISSEILTDLSTKYPVVATALKKFCRQRMLSNLMNTAPLFAPFNRNDRRELVQKFRARDVKRGDVVVSEGKPSDGMYVVLSGEVEVSVSGNVITALKEGQVFGEMSLLERGPATATVRALRHTSLLRLPKQDFDMLILSHPQVLEHISSLIDERRKSDRARESGLL